tara:strand:- start:47697 stop:49916 length:2220 start_codon:yes stop_codon:yes gene_type:complete
MTKNGNKTDNGVHEIGTKEIVSSYQNDTPGQAVEEYLSQIAVVQEEQKEKKKKHFSQVFDNPLVGFPYNEEFTVTEIKEEVLAEGMSKLLSPAQQKGILKKWNEPEGSTFADNVYSNAKIANKKDFIVTSHPVKDGDYYLSLLGNAPDGKEDKPLIKANTNMNADIRKICAKWKKVASQHSNPAGMCYLEIEKDLCDNKYNSFAASDTMVRDVVWGMVEDLMGTKIITEGITIEGGETIEEMKTQKFNKLAFVGKKVKRGRIAEGMLEEDYKKVIKMFPRDNDWKKLITKHKRAIDDFRKNNKDLPSKVENELLTWASQTGEVSGKDDAEDFILSILDEKFSPYSDKQYPRCVDFYIQFRGGKGDRITSPENKKDFEKATKMIDAYCKSNKIKQKPVYSTPEEGSSAYKVGLMIDKTYSKTSDYDDGKDLQPLYVALSKLKTAEDHGGGWSQAVVKEDEVEEGKDKIKYRGNLKGLMDSTMKEETELTEAPKLKNLMPEFEKIVKTKGAAKVQGTMVDMFTASVIVKAYNQVNDKNKKRMETSNVFTLIKLAQKVMGMKEGKMDGQKLTGQEISVYFRKNRVNDKTTKKAVEIALDHGGAMSYAIKQIEKLKKGLSKNKDVKKALQFANENFNHKLPMVEVVFKEDIISEEVQDITVDPKNKKFSSPADQNYHGMEIAKQARRFGLKSAVMGKHVRIKGAKKKVNDFLRVVIGKESYGDPTNGDYTTPQIDKILNKGMK